MPTTTTKQVRANTYLYFTYYDATDKKKKEVYCGLEDDPKNTEKIIPIRKKRSLFARIFFREVLSKDH